MPRSPAARRRRATSRRWFPTLFPNCSLACVGGRGTVYPMRELLILAIHLLVTVAKLLRPGGARAVAAESLLLKHQLLISNRSRQRAPNLTTLDRFVLGLTTLFLNPCRIPKLTAPSSSPRRCSSSTRPWSIENTACSFLPRPIGANPVRKALRWNSSRQSWSLSAAIPSSAVYASRSRSLMPSASTSTKMSCAACSRSTTGQATREPTARPG